MLHLIFPFYLLFSSRSIYVNCCEKERHARSHVIRYSAIARIKIGMQRDFVLLRVLLRNQTDGIEIFFGRHIVAWPQTVSAAGGCNIKYLAISYRMHGLHECKADSRCDHPAVIEMPNRMHSARRCVTGVTLDTHQCVSLHAASVRVAILNRAVKRKYDLIPLPSSRPVWLAQITRYSKKMRPLPYRTALGLLTQKNDTYSQHEWIRMNA